MTTPRRWGQDALAFLIGLVVPLGVIAAAATADAPFAGGIFESGKYTRPAIGWLETGTYGQMDGGRYVPETDRLPGYPALIAGAYWLFGIGNDLALVIIQALLAAATVVFIGRTAAFIRSDLFWPAVAAAAVTFNIGFRASVVLPDLFFTFLVAGAMMGLVASVRREEPFRWLLFSAPFFGIAALTRPGFILVPLFTLPILWLILLRRANVGFLRATAYTAVPCLTLVLFLAPWLTFTNQHLGKPVYGTQSGYHLLEWVYPCLQQPSGCGTPDVATRERAQAQFERRMEQFSTTERADPLIVHEVKKDLAQELILQMPRSQLLRASVLSMVKLLIHPSVLELFQWLEVPFLYWKDVPGANWVNRLLALPGYVFTMPSMTGWLIAQLVLGLSRALQLVGVVSGLWNRRLRPASLILLACMVPLIIVNVGIGNPRYRAPAEPFLIVLAVMGGVAVFDRWRRGTSPG